MYYQPPRISPCVKGLIIANVAVFVLQLLPGGIGRYVTVIGAMIPEEAFLGFQFWRFATYMFLHSQNMLFHILFNMLALYWFGIELEDIWGRKKFLIFYFVCGIGAGLFSVFYLLTPQLVMVIGASGAVYGVLTAYAYYYPDRQILLFFIFPVRIKTLVIGLAAISVLMSLSPAGGVSHLTHLGGILIAWGYLKIWPATQFKVRQWIYRLKKSRYRL